ncbi:MAE_28990/MAE_18760 family HEPN-like nuclease [Streptomyces filipinensis]|uniref:MAE_28990/MAE_18760 family HEPN-like nuclease n=1 Tax=Streptomyces filipinensis TaxID=66887 RepID=UPI0036EEA176
MRETAAAFQAHCANLRAELDLGPVLRAALAAAHAQDRHKLTTLMARSKRQSYVSGIVSLYGLLEESVDRVIVEVADAYAGIFPSYSDLPERTQALYKELCLRSLLDKDRVRLREPLNEGAALHSLASSASNLQPQLISPVFTYATSNYRFPYIVELLLRVDVDVKVGLNSSRIEKMMSDAGLNFRGLETFLEDLVTRRNEVAHSYAHNEADMLDLDLLRAYLDVVQAFIEDLHRVACERVLRGLLRARLTSIGKVAHVWSNAIGVDMTAGEIQAPCKVVLLRESTMRVIDVQSLQSDGSPLQGRIQAASDSIALGIAHAGDKVAAGYKGAETYVLPERWSYLSVF